jgi:hypothetical protein
MRTLLRDWDTWLLWALALSIALAAAGILGATLDAVGRVT